MKKILLFSALFSALLCFAADEAADKAPDPNADFKTFASGEKAIYWSKMGGSKEFVPYGKVEIADGKVKITGAGAKQTGVSFFRSHKLPKFQIEPGDIVKISVSASGSGKLFFGVAGYLASGQHYYTYCKGFELTAEPKTITCDFKLLKAAGLVYPEILLIGPGKMTVTDFRFEELPVRGR